MRGGTVCSGIGAPELAAPWVETVEGMGKGRKPTTSSEESGNWQQIGDVAKRIVEQQGDHRCPK